MGKLTYNADGFILVKDKSLVGEKFNRLTVLRRVADYVQPSTGKRAPRYECRCDCSQITTANSYMLKAGIKKCCTRHCEIAHPGEGEQGKDIKIDTEPTEAFRQSTALAWNAPPPARES